MRRSLRRRGTHRSGWKSTSKAATSRTIERHIPTARHTVVPDSSKRLSDGLLIETSVLARLFGIKLLTLEGAVVVTPAQLSEPAEGHPVVTDTAALPRAYDVVTGPRRTQGLPTGARSGQRIGSQLADAVRLLDESAGDLEALDQG